MSMNLYFIRKIRCPKCGEVVTEEHLDFPFQTPTDLSWEVITLDDRNKQYERLCSYVDDMLWDDFVKESVKEQLKLLFDDNIEVRIG